MWEVILKFSVVILVDVDNTNTDHLLLMHRALWNFLPTRVLHHFMIEIAEQDEHLVYARHFLWHARTQGTLRFKLELMNPCLFLS